MYMEFVVQCTCMYDQNKCWFYISKTYCFLFLVDFKLLCTICRFEIINGVKYVYFIKHAYKFLLRPQVGFVAVLWRLRQCVSCNSLIHMNMRINEQELFIGNLTKQIYVPWFSTFVFVCYPSWFLPDNITNKFI